MRNYSDQSHHSLEQLSSYMSQLSVAFVQARRAPNQIDANAINTFFEQLLELDAALIQAMTSSSNIKSTTQSTKNKLKQNLNDDPEDIDPEALKAEYMKEHNLKVSGLDKILTPYQLLGEYLGIVGMSRVMQIKNISSIEEMCELFGIVFEKSLHAILPQAKTERTEVVQDPDDLKPRNQHVTNENSGRQRNKIVFLLNDVLCKLHEFKLTTDLAERKIISSASPLNLNEIKITQMSRMREAGKVGYPYYHIVIPGLNRSIVISDHDLDAVYIYDSQLNLTPDDLATMHKHQLQTLSQRITRSFKPDGTIDYEARKVKVAQALLLPLDMSNGSLTAEQLAEIKQTPYAKNKHIDVHQLEALKQSFRDEMGDIFSNKRERLYNIISIERIKEIIAEKTLKARGYSLGLAKNKLKSPLFRDIELKLFGDSISGNQWVGISIRELLVIQYVIYGENNPTQFMQKVLSSAWIVSCILSEVSSDIKKLFDSEITTGLKKSFGTSLSSDDWKKIYGKPKYAKAGGKTGPARGYYLGLAKGGEKTKFFYEIEKKLFGDLKSGERWGGKSIREFLVIQYMIYGNNNSKQFMKTVLSTRLVPYIFPELTPEIKQVFALEISTYLQGLFGQNLSSDYWKNVYKNPLGAQVGDKRLQARGSILGLVKNKNKSNLYNEIEFKLFGNNISGNIWNGITTRELLVIQYVIYYGGELDDEKISSFKSEIAKIPWIVEKQNNRKYSSVFS